MLGENMFVVITKLRSGYIFRTLARDRMQALALAKISRKSGATVKIVKLSLYYRKR